MHTHTTKYRGGLLQILTHACFNCYSNCKYLAVQHICLYVVSTNIQLQGLVLIYNKIYPNTNLTYFHRQVVGASLSEPHTYAKRGDFVYVYIYRMSCCMILLVAAKMTTAHEQLEYLPQKASNVRLSE